VASNGQSSMGSQVVPRPFILRALEMPGKVNQRLTDINSKRRTDSIHSSRDNRLTTEAILAQIANSPTPIQVRLENVSQLFDTMDPYPFPERDLDKDAEEYIVSWARELPRDQPIAIIIHVPFAELSKHDPRILAEALNRYFEYRAGIVTRDLNELFRVGRTALLIGLAVLGFCLTAAQFASRRLGDMPLSRFIQESLIILGWVANWKPIEIFLYDWWPLVRRRNLYRRLAHASVQLKAYDAASSGVRDKVNPESPTEKAPVRSREFS
jgi:hypothetical protein